MQQTQIHVRMKQKKSRPQVYNTLTSPKHKLTHTHNAVNLNKTKNRAGKITQLFETYGIVATQLPRKSSVFKKKQSACDTLRVGFTIIFSPDGTACNTLLERTYMFFYSSLQTVFGQRHLYTEQMLIARWHHWCLILSASKKGHLSRQCHLVEGDRCGTNPQISHGCNR